MANYITLNSKRYLTTRRDFTPTRRKAQQVRTTLGGKTVSQTFGFTDERWAFTILVQITPDDPLYGSAADLETAYGLAYVSFTDVFGNTSSVYTEGELAQPPKYALVDPTAHYEVALILRKRQA